MRDIEFRGKVIASYNGSDGKWVYGDLFRHGTAVQIKEFVKATFSVGPETVGQFTGLLDSNGNKIFEGDIVKICCGHEDETTINEILFGNAEWEAHTIGGDYDSLYNQIVNCDHEAEVIGNIHDNPELLNSDEWA